MDIETLKFNKDNYAYLISNGRNAAIVDPGNYNELEGKIEPYNLTHILLTHYHNDHSGGAMKLQRKYPSVEVVDCSSNLESLFGEEISIIKTPGHTNDSCCFYLPKQEALFTGDTLFTSCCGRVFEGTYKDMHESLLKLSKLPESTDIYPGHEYLKYCLNFIEHIGRDVTPYKELLKGKTPSVGVNLGFELSNNPFLTNNYEEFKRLRELKNSI